MLRNILALVSVGALVLACSAASSKSGTDGAGAGGGGTTSSSSSSGSSSSGAGGSVPNGCNGLTNKAPEIQPTDVTTDAPTPAGGTIADGTYFETAETHYAQATAGPTGDKHRTMLVVSGMKWQLVSTTAKGAPDYQSSEVVDPSGIELGDQLTCPQSGVLLGDQYTATSSQLTVFQVFSGKVLVGQTYVKQP